jgi:hypothetical protein
MGDELNEAVLADSQLILDVVGTTTTFTGSGELIVHSFNSGFVKSLNCFRTFSLVSLSGEQGFKCDEGQDGAWFIERASVIHDEASQTKSQFLVVNMMGKYTSGHRSSISKE